MPDQFSAINQLVRRFKAIHTRSFRWYDWGRPVMILIGREDGGSFDGIPRPHDLWFRHENGRMVTTRDYTEVRARNDGEWRIFDSQNDGFEIVIGWWPGPDGNGRIQQSGLDGRAEQRLFLRWFVWDGWIKAEWFGLRRWLYYKALHAVVTDKVPFTCQQVPPPNSGGYSHWHCQLRRKHKGDHRYRNYTWSGSKVEYAPVDGTAPKDPMPEANAIEPRQVIALVEEYVRSSLDAAEKYTNSTLLDSSGVWSLHQLARDVYALGVNDGVAQEGERARQDYMRERDARKAADNA